MRWVAFSVACAIGFAVLRWGWETVAAWAVAVLALVAFLWVAFAVVGGGDTERDSSIPIAVGEVAKGPGMYVIGVDMDDDGNIDRVKIGMSNKDMRTRWKKELQTAAFTRLWPVCSFPTDEPGQMELMWHREYSEYRHRDADMGTEWFNVEGRLKEDLLADGAVLETRHLR